MTDLRLFRQNFVIWIVFQITVAYAGVLQTSKSNTDVKDLIIDPGNGNPIIIPGNVDVEIDIPGAGGGGGASTIIPGTSTTMTTFPIVSPGPGTTGGIVKGLDCGSTVQMFPGNMAHVFSTNFGVANYYNNEACIWRFEANQCTLSTHCPCVELPRSWECLGDYLKISTDYILQNQRFCGGNRPGQPIYSDTDFLSIKFRSDSRQTAAGFTCFVRCEGPGTTLPIVTNVTCPTSF